MSNELDDLKKKWKDARKTVAQPTIPPDALIAKAIARKKSSLYFHYGNIVVLTITLITISFCLQYFFPFKDTLSKAGVGLMMAGLMIRIVVELWSSVRSLNINLSEQALKTTDDTLKFYQLRKIIHGPVTYVTVGMYMVGFYMLSPEFSRYIAMNWIIIMDVSFIIGACILIFVIKKGIRKEMLNLAEILELKRELINEKV